MGWFRKSKTSELELARQFTLGILRYVQQEWGTIAPQLRPGYCGPTDRLNGTWPQVYFALAVIAAQMHALPNLFPSDQAARIRGHVLAILGNLPELGDYRLQTIEAFDEAWEGALAASEPPWGNVAAVLFDLLQLRIYP